MKAHEQKLLEDAIKTSLELSIKNKNLKLIIIIENIILILLGAGVITWIGI